MGVGGTARHHQIRAVEDVRIGASADVTGTTETSAPSASPPAMASATFLVAPNIDS